MLINYTLLHIPTGKVIDNTGEFLSEVQALRMVNFWNKQPDYKYILNHGQGGSVIYHHDNNSGRF